MNQRDKLLTEKPVCWLPKIQSYAKRQSAQALQGLVIQSKPHVSVQKRAVGADSRGVLRIAVTQNPLASAARAVNSSISDNGRPPAQRRRSSSPSPAPPAQRCRSSSPSPAPQAQRRKSTTFQPASRSMDSFDSAGESGDEEDPAIAAAVASRLYKRGASASSGSVDLADPGQRRSDGVAAGRGGSPPPRPGGRGGGAPSDSEWGSELEEPVAPNTASGALFVGGTLAVGLVMATAFLGGTTSELPEGAKGGVLGFGSSLTSSQGVLASCCLSFDVFMFGAPCCACLTWRHCALLTKDLRVAESLIE